MKPNVAVEFIEGVAPTLNQYDLLSRKIGLWVFIVPHYGHLSNASLHLNVSEELVAKTRRRD